MNNDLTHVIDSVFNRPWAVTPEMLDTIAELVSLRSAGGHLAPAEIQARLELAAAANGPRYGQRQHGAIGVLPIYGPIMPKAGLMTALSGASSIEQIRTGFRALLADDAVSAIILDIDSPGGRVDLVPEMATEILAARGRKPIVAIANTLMASAAYWLASSADEIVASPSANVGSIGVVIRHVEVSRANERIGITHTLIQRPATKAEGNDLEPLGDEARTHFQMVVDDIYAMFVGAVAKGRGVAAAAVRDGYGKGRVLPAARAKTAGLVDRVETFDETVRRLSMGSLAGPAFRAAASRTGLMSPREREAAAALALARARVQVRR